MNIGLPEILFVLLLALLLFGAKRLPEIARSFGKAVREFKSGINNIGGDDIHNNDSNNSSTDEEDNRNSDDVYRK